MAAIQKPWTKNALVAAHYLMLASIVLSLFANMVTARLLGEAALGIGRFSGEPGSPWMEHQRRLKRIADALLYCGFGCAISSGVLSVAAMRASRYS